MPVNKSLLWRTTKGRELLSKLHFKSVVTLSGLAVRTRSEKRTDDLGYSENYFDVIYSRRSPTNYPLFYRLLKPGGHVLYIGIGEKDTQELKETFGRGQNFGKWDTSALEKEREDIEKAGFKIIYEADFYYNEYYLSYNDLDVFLQGVPIFEDYDSQKDREYLEEYTKKFQTKKGIDLPRHRIVVVATKRSIGSRS